tara:strand:- start:39062 stop:40225 length:1164 start_codon:yes stop_codon:yes gene_type:complete
MIVLFGVGNIALKTIKKYSLDPNKCIAADNSYKLWNKKWNNIDVINPKNIKKLNLKKIIICTTSYNEVSKQLSFMKIPKKNIEISKVLDNYRVIDKIENIKFDIIFVSGVQSIEKNKKGGGVYRLKGNFEKYNYKKLYSGNCHCVISNNQKEIYVSDVNEGIVKLDLDGRIKQKIKISSDARPHGFTKMPNGDFLVALSEDDSVIHINDKGRIKKKYRISKLIERNNIAQHHVNDISFFDHHIYVSMFSIKGSWQSGIYDGGVAKINIKNGSKKFMFGDLIMPHNIIINKKGYYICDSFMGKLITNKRKVLFETNGFLRGLDIKDDFIALSESKNRNFSNIKNGPLNSSLDTRINIIDRNNRVFKSIQLLSPISEIHSIKIINLETK